MITPNLAHELNQITKPNRRQPESLQEAISRLTPKQQEVAMFMVTYWLKHDRLPSAHRVAQEFNFSSDNSSQTFFRYLELKRFVETSDEGHRRFTLGVVNSLRDKSYRATRR